MIVYVDTSAVFKLVVTEPESVALAHWVDHLPESDVVTSSWLLHAELHCAVTRRADPAIASTAERVLAGVAKVDIDRADLLAAPRLPGRLRSADAIHLATAVRIGAGLLVTYDPELLAAASLAGVGVHAPR